MASCISAVNSNYQIGPRKTSKFGSPTNSDRQTVSFSFGGSESMGPSLRLASTRAAKSTTRLSRKRGSLPLRVVCVDCPRPELENTVNFLEAAYLSSAFRASPRPPKPLKVVIAGAGNIGLCQVEAKL